MGGKCLQFGSALVPKDGHQGHNEISLVELLPLPIDAHKHFGDRFDSDGGYELQRNKLVLWKVVKLADRVLNLVSFLACQIALRQTADKRIGEGQELRSGAPDRRDVWDVCLVFLYRGVSDVEALRQWVKCDLDALALEIAAQHFRPLDNGVQGGQPLLPVHNGEFGHGLVILRPNALQSRLGSRFPKQQETCRIPAVEGVEEITDVDVRPDERPLQFRQSNFSQVYIFDKCIDRIVGRREQRHRYAPSFVERHVRSVAGDRGKSIKLQPQGL